MSNSDSQRDFTGAFGQREHLACTAQVSVWPVGPAHGAVSSSGSAHSKWHSNSPSFFLCWSAAVFTCSSSSNYINLSNICCLQWSCLIFGLLLRGLMLLWRGPRTQERWCLPAIDALMLQTSVQPVLLVHICTVAWPSPAPWPQPEQPWQLQLLTGLEITAPANVLL